MDSTLDALRNSSAKIVGTKQVIRGLKNGTLAHVWLAVDADTFLYQQVYRAAEAARVPVTRVSGMKELGEACGVAVKTAAAGIARA